MQLLNVSQVADRGNPHVGVVDIRFLYGRGQVGNVFRECHTPSARERQMFRPYRNLHSFPSGSQ